MPNRMNAPGEQSQVANATHSTWIVQSKIVIVDTDIDVVFLYFHFIYAAGSAYVEQ